MRTTYVELPVQRVDAIQFTGSNAAAVVEFDPTCLSLGGPTGVQLRYPIEGRLNPVATTEWVIDDPIIGYVVQVTDESFRARFNVN